jgi:hypothetical protein
VLVLTMFGLLALAIWPWTAAGLAREIRRRLHGPAASDEGEELIDDLDGLDELHHRGDLAHGDLVAAKRRRCILGLRYRSSDGGG